MADKLSWTELRRILASRAGVSEKTAGAFLSAVQSELIAALKNDKQVRINGLGIFRIQSIAPRKSVSVASGEEMIIEGYNKLAFTPEAGVKELIERGDVIDPIQKLGAQAEEIVDLLGELGQRPNGEAGTEERVATAEETQPVVEKNTESAPVVEEAVPVVEEAVPVVEKAPVMEEVPVEEEPTPVVEEAVPVVEQKKKKNHFVRDTLIAMLVLIVLLAVGYFFLRQKLSDIIRSYIKPAETEQVVEATPEEESATDTIFESEPYEVTSDEVTSQKDLIPEGEISQEQILAEFLAASGEIELSEDKYEGFITTEPMHEGSRLTWMAKRYYGAKIYWPYLYDANRDVIINPSHIAVGTPLRVPRLSAAQLDTTATAFIQLKEEAEAACRK